MGGVARQHNWALQPTVIRLIEAVTHWAALLWSQSILVLTSRKRCKGAKTGATGHVMLEALAYLLLL